MWGKLDISHVFHYISTLHQPIFKKLVTKLKIFWCSSLSWNYFWSIWPQKNLINSQSRCKEVKSYVILAILYSLIYGHKAVTCGWAGAECAWMGAVCGWAGALLLVGRGCCGQELYSEWAGTILLRNWYYEGFCVIHNFAQQSDLPPFGWRNTLLSPSKHNCASSNLNIELEFKRISHCCSIGNKCCNQHVQVGRNSVIRGKENRWFC